MPANRFERAAQAVPNVLALIAVAALACACALLEEPIGPFFLDPCRARWVHVRTDPLQRYERTGFSVQAPAGANWCIALHHRDSLAFHAGLERPRDGGARGHFLSVTVAFVQPDEPVAPGRIGLRSYIEKWLSSGALYNVWRDRIELASSAPATKAPRDKLIELSVTSGERPDAECVTFTASYEYEQWNLRARKFRSGEVCRHPAVPGRLVVTVVLEEIYRDGAALHPLLIDREAANLEALRRSLKFLRTLQ